MSDANRISRRELLKAGLIGGLGTCAVLPDGRVFAAERRAQPAEPRAKSVIQIWLWGGPAQLDTFDPKPEAGSDYTGPFTSPIETNVSGIRINELLTELAKVADK